MIFISYATENLAYATELFKRLYLKKYNVWFAPVAIKYGANFTQEITDALNNNPNGAVAEQLQKMNEDELIDARMKNCASCKALIFICSRFSKNSAWCRKEVKIAIKRGIPISKRWLSQTIFFITRIRRIFAKYTSN